jgi:mevalonate kinase
VKASAPGKIILFGEHAVVYGHPALAVPVTQVRAEVDISQSAHPGIWIDAPEVGLHVELNELPANHPLAAAIHNLFFALDIDPFPSLIVRVSSTIPVASGLGSGAAVSVALLRALSTWLQRPLSDEEINAYAYDIEKLHHGTPSGIDNAVVTYSRPVFFVKDRPIELLQIRKPFTIVIGDTGLAAPTKDSVGDVRRLWQADGPRCEAIFERIGSIAREARTALEGADWQQLGALMDLNHALLQELTVSSPELDRLVSAARQAGALGAKLSGGGRGGNMIALVREAGQGTQFEAGNVESALRSAGALRTIVTTISV